MWPSFTISDTRKCRGFGYAVFCTRYVPLEQSDKLCSLLHHDIMYTDVCCIACSSGTLQAMTLYY